MFSSIKKAVTKKFSAMEKDELFVVDLDKDELWQAYLNSFEDPIIRQEHNCNCCKQFIRNCGNVVSIKDGKIDSIWNVEAGEYSNAAKAMLDIVKASKVKTTFLSKFDKLGTDRNLQLLENGTTKEWEHFYHKLSSKYVNKSGKSIETIQGNAASIRNVFKRSLDELTIDATETVLELIAQNSLYRGQEFEAVLKQFLKHQKKYKKLKREQRDLYAWENFKEGGKVRNSAIGTLLIDLSEGKELDRAVASFEAKVAPANYKRPKAIVTKKMIENAEKEIKALGLEDSLYRRNATLDDIPVNEVIFANRDSKKLGGLFEELKADVVMSSKQLSKVEEISIDDFVKKVVPTATEIEVLFERKHSPNLMSLVAPVNAEAPSLFKWNNALSWDYNGGAADSMKERVKSAGGKVDGVLRFSIQWNEEGQDSSNDLDAHCHEAGGYHLYYGNRENRATGGNLDVDIQRPGGKTAVENITWPSLNKMKNGKYSFSVHNFSGRNSGGFRAEIEFDGEVYEYNYDTSVKGTVSVAEVTLKNGVFSIKHNLKAGSNTISEDIWNIGTNKFHKVSMITTSPNHWEKAIGNKHYFFLLEDCKSDTVTRGFYNEFLKDNLLEHKRLFEVLGNKMKVQESENSLSGLGFSSTQHNEVIVKVKGKFERTMKVKF